MQESFFALEKDLPYASKYIEHRGHRLHYLDEGTGPVVFLLHGNPTWCFFYRTLIERLKDRFRVIALDYIGCGLSDHPTDVHFRAIDRVGEVEALYGALGVDRFSIVMHDWGGAIGTKFLQRHLDKVDGVVYLNTTLTEIESLPAMIKFSAHPLIGQYLTQYTPQFLRYLTGPGSIKKLPRAVREGYFYPYQTSARRTAIWDFVSDIPFSQDHPTYQEMVDLAEGFRQMQQLPIKIVWGLRDPCFHAHMLKKVSAHFPQADIVEVADGGHLVLEDAPELAGSEIREFLIAVTTGKYAPPTKRHMPTPGANALYRAFRSLPEHLAGETAVIAAHPSRGAVRYAPISHRDLLALVHQYERGLTELGLRPGDRVLMLVQPGEDFLALAYAVMGRGAIPAFVDPGVGKEKLFRCIRDCDPHVFIGSPRAHLLRLKRPTLFPNLKFSIWSTTAWAFGGHNLSFLRSFSTAELPPEQSPEGVAFIAFTSGATGTPKGVIFTNEMIEAELRIFRETFGFEIGSKDLPLLPIFSIFSLALGVTSIFPPMNPAKPLSLDPGVIVRIVRDLSVQSSFGSPTLWEKISNYCVRHSEQLPSLKTVLMAGAPVSEQLLNRVERLGSEIAVRTPYGATECLPVTLARAEDICAMHGIAAQSGEVGTPVGRPLEGTEVRIIKLADPIVRDIADTTACEPLEIGEIIVRGAQVSPAYLNRVDANLQGKIMDGSSFWHRIGDVGYQDKTGNLFYCGRKAHIVQTSERPFYSDPVENVFNRSEKVRRTALVQSPGGVPGVAVEPVAGHFPTTQEARNQFISELMSIGADSPITAQIERFYFFKSFPVDARHNAKIFRDQLSEKIERNEFH